MTKKKFRDGFTLIELSISMIFIGLLSLSIVLIISNTISAYQRGLTLNRINSVGSALVDDMRSAIQSSSARALLAACSANSPDEESRDRCLLNNAYDYVSVTRTAEVELNNKRTEIPIYGVFCTGTYSYVWNSGYFESEKQTMSQYGFQKIKITYKEQGSDELFEYNNFRLIKIQDEDRSICVAATNISTDSNIDLSEIGNGTLGSKVDLLPSDNASDLALYDLSVATPTVSVNGDNIFYSISFVLGTTNGGANITANGSSCNTSESTFVTNNCAINQFNFAVQVNGG